MAEFLIKEDGFKFGIFDKVPTAISGQSILLYRRKDGINGSMVIKSGFSPYAADVRRGKSVMDDYLDGKMSGEKIHEMLREKKREDLAYLKDGLDNDILQEDFVRQEYSKKIAGGSLAKEPVLEIETSSGSSGDKIEKYIDVQEIGDDDNL